MELIGTYDWLLVIVSVIAATFASFVALSVVPRIYDSKEERRSLIWVLAFGLCLGTGIWTMHFIGMLAFHLPIPVEYDLKLTVLSLLLAVVVSAIAISPLRSGGEMKLFSPKTLFIGTMMGLGVACMHYTGMAAMRLDATMQHEPLIVVIAISIAIIASTAALLIANGVRDTRIFNHLGIKLLAAVIMGLAVSSMHYTAMAGMNFYAIEEHHIYSEVIDPIVLTIFILIVTFLVQGGTIITALMDEAYSITKRSELIMKRRADINQALSDILALALKNLSLNDILQQVLDRILDIEWLSFDKKGCIFLTHDKKNSLHMAAQRNVCSETLNTCNEVAFGCCLCGKAAERQMPIMKNCIDEEHEIHTTDMQEHGHYCIPISASDHVLGVINIYVKHGQQNGDDEINFLKSAADAVASIIQSKKLESQAIKIFSAIDQAGEAVLITDYDGVIEYVNQAYCHNTGYSDEEIVGRKPSITKSGYQDNDLYQQMWITIKSGEVWQGEVTERRKDGSYYPAMLSISPIRNEGGEITHFVGIHEDLSEHKQLEAQFRQAQKMEALGTLVGGIAHDFNNMLAGMVGNLFLVKKRVQGMSDVEEKINRIESVSFQAADMIKQMLIFARSEQVDMNTISFSTFIKEILKLHQVVIPDNVKLNTNIGTSALKITGNPTQLQQLLLNLVGNAVDAVQQVENPVITLALEETVTTDSFCAAHPNIKEGTYAHLSISDNGYGIDEEHLERIFDPFFTTKEVGKGTGLGLAMSDTIVKSHKGIIEVNSAMEKGSEFHIYLPLIEASTASIESNSLHAVPEGRGERILIVDDNESLRDTTAEALESSGYATIVAANGQEALELYQSIKVDIVLLDVVMPVMGGAKAARAILNINAQANIIFATGYDKESSLAEIVGLESIPVLSKPFEINQLLKTIHLLLN